MSETSYIQRRSRPLHIYAILYLAFLYIPVLFLPLFSVNDSIYVAFPLKEFTTKWYVQLFNNEPMFSALMNSVKVGASYQAGGESIEAVSTFISQTGEDAATRMTNYQDSVGWYGVIAADMFG